MTVSYRLTGRLEAGDLAELYQGSQESGGDVVVKLFHAKTSDPAYARALAETSRVLNPLRHAGIVRYVDIGFVKQRLAVVREYVNGYTLGTALQRLHGKEVLLPSAVALYLVIHLLETVQKAHDAGIVHGAITPGNLLLSRDGVPGICDFGALNALIAVPELKRGFATRGRSAYRAPEVGRGDEPTAVSDVYSLGSIAYELLTLREAVVSGGGTLSTRSGGLPPPSRLDRRINTRLDPIILRALEPLPNRRYRSAADFASGLRGFLSAQGGMPGQEELRRFVRELLPNELNLLPVGPLPFSDAFTLTPVSGAELADVHAEPLEASVVARAPFSRSFSMEEARAITAEEMPAITESRPEDWSPPEPTATDGPSGPEPWDEKTSHVRATDEEPALAATHIRPTVEPSQEATAVQPPRQEPSSEPTALRPPRQEPYAPLQPTRAGQKAPVAEREDTEPSGVGPLEHGWDAPPGAQTPRARKPPVQSGGATPGREGTSVGRNPRLKWVEDFSEERTHIAAELQGDAPPPKPARKGTGLRASLPLDAPTRPPSEPPTRPPPSMVRPPPAEEPTRTYVPKERRDIALPPSTGENMRAAVPRRRIFTEERFLLALARRRSQALGVVVAIVLVGLFVFAVAVWRFDGPPAQPAPVTPITPVAEDPARSRSRPERMPVVAAPNEDEGAAESAQPEAGSAFVTLRTNVPARVFIDGTPVRRRTPLYRYPVKAGTRTFILEAEGTRERFEFSLRFDRGQHRTIDQEFQSTPRR